MLTSRTGAWLAAEGLLPIHVEEDVDAKQEQESRRVPVAREPLPLHAAGTAEQGAPRRSYGICWGERWSLPHVQIGLGSAF